MLAVLAALALLQAQEAEDPRVARALASLAPPLRLEGAEPIAWTLAERMQAAGVSAVSIALVDGGRVAWTRAVGTTRAGGGEPVTPDTPFQAASIAKPVTALAALVLVERGELALDEPLAAGLRSWSVPENELSARTPPTLRHALAHRAGFTQGAVGTYAPGAPLPTIVQALEGAPPATTQAVTIDLEPGTRARYSGGGYTVVQALLEDVTERGLDELARELVFDPVGMRASSFLQPPPQALASIAAKGHDARGEPLPGGFTVLPQAAAGGLWTTAGDLARLWIELERAWLGAEGALLPLELAREMAKDHGGGYGLGLIVGEDGGAPRIEHTGSNPGYRAIVVGWPGTGAAAAILTNGDAGDGLRAEILRGLAREYGWPGYAIRARAAIAQDPAEAAALPGVYDYGRGYRTTVTLEDGRLLARLNEGEPTELHRATPLEYFSLFDTTYRFERAADGPVTGLVADLSGAELRARKVE